MSTLQELRKQKYSTIKAFADAYGRSANVASWLLKGRHHHTLSREDIAHLATVLGVTFDECVAAENATYKEYFGDRIIHQSLEELWKRQEAWSSAAFKGAKFDDWSEWDDLQAKWNQEQQERINQHWQRQHATSPSSMHLDALGLLGLSHNATHDEIKAAFRQKVKDASNGQGGYDGDMDKLVQAKEQALAQVK